MPSRNEEQSERNLDVIVRSLGRVGAPDSGVPEETLWAYALNVLEPQERDRVLKQIANSQVTQVELRRIERAIAIANEAEFAAEAAQAAASVAPITPLEEKIRNVLRSLGRDLDNVIGGVVQIGQELSLVFGREAPSTLATLQLSLEYPQEQSDDEAQHQPGGREREKTKAVTIESAEGFRVTLIRNSEQSVNIIVQCPSERLEAMEGELAEIYQMTSDTGSRGDWIDDCEIKGGKASFRDVRKDGLLEIRLPGDCRLPIYVALSPP